MAHIFISYSSQDQAPVDQLIKSLEASGYPVWVDRQDIHGADLWREKIVHAIETCDVFVLALSPHSASSDNVRRELDLASENKKLIMPVLIQPTDLPDTLKYQLAGIHYIDLYRNFQNGFNKLLADLATKGITPVGGVSPPPSPPSPHKNLLVISTAVVALVLIGAFAFYRLFIPKPPPVYMTPTSQGVLTVQASQSTQTESEPSTITPIPEPPSTLTPVVRFGTTCIPSLSWTLYPNADLSKDSRGCWNLDTWGLSAGQGSLSFDIKNTASDVNNGIYTPLTNDNLVEFDLQIDRLDTIGSNILVNLALGVIPSNPVNLDLYGKVYYQRESSSPGYPINVKRKPRGGFEEYIKLNDQYLTYNLGTSIHLAFDLRDDNLQVYQDGTLILQVNVSFTPKVFYIGWLVPAGGAIQAQITNFKVVSR